MCVGSVNFYSHYYRQTITQLTGLNGCRNYWIYCHHLNPPSGRVGESSEPVSGWSDGGMQCNGMEPFDRAGIRQFHPKAVL
jgi:hypothetical protein